MQLELFRVYINGIGSDLDQMRYLMDSAAEQQKTLGLKFGVALTAAQVAALDHSLLWWEAATINGQTVMIPKVYLSPKDVTVHSGNNVQLAGGNVINSGSTIAALKATKAALSGVQASQGAEMAQINGDPNSGIGVSVSLSSQKSKSEQHMQSDTVAGSTLNAGNNLSITATGKEKGENSGNILIGGSQLKAGGDTALVAANDIVLGGAASTQQTTGKNSSSGGGAGVSIGGGKSGYGIGVFANVNASKGSEKGDGTARTETTLDSGGTVSMTSGRDAILNGAQVSGDKIVADIGRDLWMSSQQDSNDYKSTQNSTAAGGSFSFGSMTGSGYISASQDKTAGRRGFGSGQRQQKILQTED